MRAARLTATGEEDPPKTDAGQREDHAGVQPLAPLVKPGPHNIPGYYENHPELAHEDDDDGGAMALSSPPPVPIGWGPFTTDFYRNVPVQIQGWYYYYWAAMVREQLLPHSPIYRWGGAGWDWPSQWSTWVFRWKQGYENPPWNSPPTPSWWPSGPVFAVEAGYSEQWPPGNWTFTPSGLCMNIPYAWTHSGVDAQLYPCVGASNERHEVLDKPDGIRVTWLHAGSYANVCFWNPSACQCWNQEPPPGNAFQQYACQSPSTENEQWGFRYWECNVNGTLCGNDYECCSGFCNPYLTPSKCTYDLY